MAAAALLKFVQGATVGVNGQALVVATGTAVVVSNADNTGVKSWQIDLAYVDPASAMVTTTPFAFNNDDSVPTVSYVPDVRGSWRWVLKVWDAKNRVGNPTDVDIRVASVPEAHGFIVPPAQIWPLPLPDPASNLAGAKPNELNFNGQLNGFAGNGTSDGLLNKAIRTIDAFAGSSFSVVGTPSDGNLIGYDATSGNWVPVSRSAFSITAFAAVTSLVEVGSSAVNPAFNAALSAGLISGDTAVLTNNADSEAKDVHTTPTSFASSHTFAFTAPNQSVAFTYTVKKVGNPAAVSSAGISSAQRSYAGVVAGGASPATLIAAAVANPLTTVRSFSFVLTDDGTHKGQVYIPTRYGAPTIKDRSTGFAIAYTLLGAASHTNPSGFAESYSQYEFVSTFNSTLTVDVT